MNGLWQFFYWLTTYADQHTWLTLVRQAGDARVVYGGNFLDAFHYAQAIGGFVSQVVS